MKSASLRFATVAALFLAAASGALATVSEKFSQTYPLKADGTVSLSNVNGAVEIVAWDRAEVSVEAEKIASDADILKRMQIEVESSPEKLAIKTKHEKTWKLWGRNRAEIRYKLRVPAGASLKKIEVVNADLTVQGVKGYADLDSVNGSIKADGLAGGGRFDTVNGSIRVSFAALAKTDRITLDAVNGSCNVTLPADAAFDLKADSVNGGISCDFPITLHKSGRHHLSGSVNGGGAQIALDSVNGRLNVSPAH